MDKTVGIRLQVGATGLENINQLSRALQAAGVETAVLDNRAAELDAELKRLNDQQRLIDAFVKQKAAVSGASAAMDAAKTKAGELAREISAADEPTAKQQRAFDKARQAARDAAQQYEAQRLKLQDLRGAMQSAGVSTESLAASQVAVRRGIASAADEVQRLAGTYRSMVASTRDAATAGDAAAGAATRGAAAFRAEAAAAGEASGRVSDMVSQLRTMTAIDLASQLGGQAISLVKDVGATAEAFANLQARVKLVTGDGAAFQAAMKGISDISLGTNSNLEDTAKLFTRVAQAGNEIGVGQAEALRLTETINKAVQLGGESADSSRAAVTQLIQGLQSGVLRGEEFNSVMEQAPRLARALADGLGVTVGQLRALAMNGELSSQTVIRALQQQRAVLDKEFATLPATVGRALENLSTRWTLFVGDLTKGAQQAGIVANGINGLANNLDNIAGMAARAGTVLTAALAVEGANALRALVAQAGAGGGALAALTKKIEQVPKIINIAVAVVGLEVGYQLGQMLYENSELARKLGVGIAEFFTGLVSDLQFVAESAKAVFTNDTVAQAFDRYKQRAEEQRAIYQGLYDDAAKSPEVVRAAAASAAAETASLGATATAAGSQVAAAGAAGAAGMGSVGKAAEDAKSAIANLLGQMQAVTPALAASARQQADAMVAVALAGGKAADTFRKDLPEAINKLSGAELSSLRNLLVQSLTDARVQAEALAAAATSGSAAQAAALSKAAAAADTLRFALVEIGKQAAQSLGVELANAASTVSTEFQRSLDNLSVLVRSMPQLRAAGVDAASAVAIALSKMIDGARNTAELDAIRDRLSAMGKAGVIGGDQVKAALAQAADKARALKAALEDVTPGIQSLGEALRTFGLQSRDELQATADKMAASWQLIRDSTVVALDQKIDAFARYRDAAIAANGGVESSEIALQRRILETQAQVKGLGDEFERSMARARAATSGVGGGSGAKSGGGAGGGSVGGNGDTAASAPRAVDLSGVSARNRQITDDAATASAERQRANGVPIDNSYQFALRDRLRRGDSFSADELPAILNAYRVAQDNARLAARSTVPDAKGTVDAVGWVETLRQVVEKAQADVLAADLADRAPAAERPTRAAAPAAPTSTVHTVRVDLGAGRQTSFNVASAADAAAAEAFIRQLEDAMRRANGGS